MITELEPTGAPVTLFEPRMFATDFSITSHVVEPDETYALTVRAFLTRFPHLPPTAKSTSFADAVVP